MDKPLTQRGAVRIWQKMKSYVTENAYPRHDLPELYFDPGTATLYADKSKVGYDFIVENSKIYYKERW